MPRLSFVLGGAASGKSDIAERLLARIEGPRLYLATAQGLDAEMRDKIAAHRAARGENWLTQEVPQTLPDAIRAAPAGHAVLADCLTMWLSNLILAERDPDPQFAALAQAIRAAPGPLVLVSNEVGAGIVPDTALGRRFRNAQGRLNRIVAAEADAVIGVMAGLPFALKGRLPREVDA
ncbi:bifunctional adenosylcobinamide kinase/adenosylcobinamide-phosphate guanylyltransferase [Profundibacterium mesophilum]|uniref:bifunctional adenosylcobinamide kinase/adenosylcobinamide-phosphate guanylyltransferase n=1 Tax=Profundibacterium mesophilum TaxID=1258573 RepID=UPI00135BEF14|nr:bifunctional adenosylcobinamide kinase/adenosylcobinamide-phosphate guanylyltransferase [Profundibacterium mesophilum]